MSTVYLDHAATTPVRDDVIAVMEPYMSVTFGNPSSTHRWGQDASAALEEARAKLATAIGAHPSEVRFVRGGTESDNLAVIGGARAMSTRGRAFTPETIGEAVAIRELMAGLRETGETTGGPPPFSKRDRSNFLQRLDETVNAIMRTRDKQGPG